MNYIKQFLGGIMITYSLINCTPSTSKDDVAATQQLPAEKNLVSVQILTKSTFQKELVSNGTLVAVQKSALRFPVSGELEHINVKNGARVQEGGTIARLKQFEYTQRLEQAKAAQRKALLELENVLIGLGYDMAQKDDIPANIYDMACIKSGYTSATTELTKAQHDLESTTLRAPFSGVIANLEKKQYEHTGGDDFCILINDREFEVTFQITESELRDITIGMNVNIKPFNGQKDYAGTVSEINPLVDENGLVKVKARARNQGGLMEGMNVKVLLQKKIENQLVVPKPAVLLRQNQEVLFKYINGKAYWTYVQTGLENSSSYTVIAHPDKGATLQEGDTVIISGNLNLAHDSDVEIGSN